MIYTKVVSTGANALRLIGLYCCLCSRQEGRQCNIGHMGLHPVLGALDVSLSDCYRKVRKKTCSMASGVTTITIIERIMEQVTTAATKILVDFFILTTSEYET